MHEDRTWCPIGSFWDFEVIRAKKELLTRFSFPQAVAAGIDGLFCGHFPEGTTRVIHASLAEAVRRRGIHRNIVNFHGASFVDDHPTPSVTLEASRMGDECRETRSEPGSLSCRRVQVDSRAKEEARS